MVILGYGGLSSWDVPVRLWLELDLESESFPIILRSFERLGSEANSLDIDESAVEGDSDADSSGATKSSWFVTLWDGSCRSAFHPPRIPISTTLSMMRASSAVLFCKRIVSYFVP